MTAENFPICKSDTAMYEGGYVNDPIDPAGATDRGVTQATYNAWRVSQGNTRRDVRQMTDLECTSIYKTQYWDAVRGDELFAGLDLVLYDIAVNSGPVTAIRFLQEALRVPVDGQFGLMTMGAVSAVTDRAGLIRTICDRRMSFWHSLTTYWRFGKGWTARGEGIEARALAMLGAAGTTSPPAAPPTVATIWPPIGSKAWVAWLQAALNALGASPALVLDGDYGPATRFAVTKFQTARRAVDNVTIIDGFAGPATTAALAAALASLKK
jgi:lysozyme family protein